MICLSVSIDFLLMWYLQPPQRERRHGQWLYRYRHEQSWVVVSRNSIRVQHAAEPAAMDDGPLAVFAHPHAYGFHGSAAGGGPVARFLLVQVHAGKAARAMVAVAGACAFLGDKRAAGLAGESFFAGGISGAVQTVSSLSRSFGSVWVGIKIPAGQAASIRLRCLREGYFHGISKA